MGKAFTQLDLRIDVERILTDNDFLGTYHYADGGTTNAIIILPDKNYGYEFPTQEVTVSKIEAVIIRPEHQNDFMVGGDAMVKETYKVYLKQWEIRNDFNILADALELREALQCLITELNSLDKYRLTNPIITSSDKKIGLIETGYFEVFQLYNQSFS